jgi:N utilization substance protein A
VRLAAKLIGWKVDIKSEEEKRQEVQSQMEALTTIAPLSALQEYGLDAAVEAKLIESGINTVEKLGEMTPEQLEEIPGIGAEMVEKIQLAVINYYGQYDQGEGDSGQEAEQKSDEEVIAETAEAAESIDVDSDKIETPESGAAEAEHAGSGAPADEEHAEKSL